MKPKVYDSLTRYLVDSESNPNEAHLVDLAGYGTLGECSCQHFTMKIKPVLDGAGEGVQISSADDFDKYRCKHIRLVREYVLKHVIEAYEEVSQPKPENE